MMFPTLYIEAGSEIHQGSRVGFRTQALFRLQLQLAADAEAFG